MSVWEGSGNVIALDVLRALTTSPESGQAFLDELVVGEHPSLDAHIRRLRRQLTDGVAPEEARTLTENLALALQGSLLARHSTEAVLDAFCGSRLEAGRGHSYGSTAMDAKAIVDRHAPA